jgi:hypothetical protein
MFAASPQEPNAANAYIDSETLTGPPAEPQPDCAPSKGQPDISSDAVVKPLVRAGHVPADPPDFHVEPMRAETAGPTLPR